MKYISYGQIVVVCACVYKLLNDLSKSSAFKEEGLAANTWVDKIDSWEEAVYGVTSIENASNKNTHK